MVFHNVVDEGRLVVPGVGESLGAHELARPPVEAQCGAVGAKNQGVCAAAPTLDAEDVPVGFIALGAGGVEALLDLCPVRHRVYREVDELIHRGARAVSAALLEAPADHALLVAKGDGAVILSEDLNLEPGQGVSAEGDELLGVHPERGLAGEPVPVK